MINIAIEHCKTLDDKIETICSHPAFNLDTYIKWKAWNEHGDIIQFGTIMIQEWQDREALIYAFGNVEMEDDEPEHPFEDLEREKMQTLEKITGSY